MTAHAAKAFQPIANPSGQAGQAAVQYGFGSGQKTDVVIRPPPPAGYAFGPAAGYRRFDVALLVADLVADFVAAFFAVARGFAPDLTAFRVLLRGMLRPGGR